jgi:hypothetical protein
VLLDDGFLDLEFIARLENPKVSAIEVDTGSSRGSRSLENPEQIPETREVRTMSRHPSACTVSSFSLALLVLMPWAALGANGLPRQPLAFVENQGQWPDRVLFAARAGGVLAGIEADGLSFFSDRGTASGRAAVRLTFENGSPRSLPRGVGEQPAVHHFFLGAPERWRSGVPACERVVWQELWPGVDLAVREGEAAFAGVARIEYDLILQPGADPARAVLRCEGADEIAIDASGALIASTPLGDLRQLPPQAWQVRASGDTVPVACRYRLLDSRRFGFDLDVLDPDLPLVIDPIVEWYLPLGTSGSFNSRTGLMDLIFDMGLAPDGTLVAAGQKSAFDFPFELPQGDDCWGEGEILRMGDDAFVVRLDSTSGEILSTTFIGGNSDDGAVALALDGAGRIHIAGYSFSEDFPVTNGSNHGGDVDAFIALFDPEGCELIYSTRLAGAGEQAAHAIGLGPEGDIIVAGYTASRDFPTVEGAWSTAHRGGTYDAFIARLRPGAGSLLTEQLVYSTYFGGSGDDAKTNEFWSRVMDGALKVRQDGSVVYAGRTWSSDLPSTPNAFSTTKAGSPGNSDAFLLLFRPDASLPPAGEDGQVVYLTYFGGAQNGDAPTDLVLDGAGRIWIAGHTWSNDFPLTAGAYQRQYRGGSLGMDLFVACFDVPAPPSEQLVYSTYLGGSGDEGFSRLDLDFRGRIVLLGWTQSPDLDVTAGAFDASLGGPSDAFLAVLDPTEENREAALPFLSYFGGPSHDIPGAVLTRTDGRAWVGLSSDFGPIDGVEADGHSAVGVILGLDLRLPEAAFMVRELGENRFEFDPSASSTPQGTVITGYRWDFGDGETPPRDLETPAAVSHEYSTAGRHVATLTVTNDLGLQSTARRLVTVACPAGDVSPWTAANIGEPTFPGAARWADAEPADEAEPNAGLALCAGGQLLAGTSDRFLFVYQEVEGDAVLSARIAGPDGAGWQIGVMLRESLAPEARHATMLIQRSALTGPHVRSLWRESETTRSTQGGAVELPRAHVRIERQGDEFIASASDGGSEGSYIELSRVTIEGFPHQYLAGLIAIGHEANPAAAFKPLAARVEDLVLVSRPPGVGPFLRGDSNCDGRLDLSDAVFTLARLFLGGREPCCLAAADTNGDAAVDLSDPIYGLNHLFAGGPAPLAPFPDCGFGELESDAALGCTARPERCG